LAQRKELFIEKKGISTDSVVYKSQKLYHIIVQQYRNIYCEYSVIKKRNFRWHLTAFVNTRQ